MKFIGLTGGIGSGKSTVADIFRILGIPVYDSDLSAKHLMTANAHVRHQIITLFGNEAYLEDNTLNRSWIASKVFSNPAFLRQLNSIVHPAVHEDLIQWASGNEQLSAPYLIQESAILFEENLISKFDAVILVIAPEEIKIARIMKRDNLTREQVSERMKNQWPDEKKIPFTDYIIYNDERSLIQQVKDIDLMIRQPIV